MTLLGEIGDIQRFPSPKHLISYAGLGASVHSSGQVSRTGRITKEGRRELRGTLVEAAWTAVNYNDHWRTQFERLAVRIGKPKAIVAMARKLLVVIWHVWTEGATDRHADADAVSRKFLAWGSRHRLAKYTGVKRLVFVGERLEQVGLGGRVKSWSPLPAGGCGQIGDTGYGVVANHSGRRISPVQQWLARRGTCGGLAGNRCTNRRLLHG